MTKFDKSRTNFNKNPTGGTKSMTDEEINVFNSAVRMIDFKLSNPNAFKTNAKMVSSFQAIESDVTILETAGASRLSASGVQTDGTVDKRAARADLFALVRKAVETGKTIKKEEPDFDNKFKTRRGTLGSQELLDVARAFANDLTPAVADKFSEYGAASVKAENFTDKIAAFESARTQQNAGKSGSVAATAQTKAAIGRLKKTRRTTAQIGENILEELGDAALLAAWRSACHVEKRKKKDANGDGNGGTTTPPTQ
jgi:hypothetical protein